MLTRLFRFRKRLDAVDASLRLQAVEALAGPALEEAGESLARLALTDEDRSVRLAAISRLSDDSHLGPVLDDTGCSEAAAARIAELMASGSPSAHGDHRLVVVARIDRMGSDCDETLVEFLETSTDLDLLLEVLLKIPRAFRERILTNPELNRAKNLTEIERRSRDGDKALNRLARARLERLKQLRSEAVAHNQRLREILSALDKQTARDSGSPQALRSLTGQAEQTLACLIETAEELARFGEPLADLDALARQVSTCSASAAAVEIDTPPPFEDLAARFEALDEQLQSSHDFNQLTSSRQTLTGLWLEAADHHPPTEAQHQVFHRVSHRYRELADAHDRLGHIEIPRADLTELPDTIGDDARSAQEFWREVAGRRREHKQLINTVRKLAWPEWAVLHSDCQLLSRRAEALLDSVHRVDAEAREADKQANAQLSMLAAKIESGESKSAQGMLAALRKMLRRLPPEASDTLSKQLNHEAARLSELKDWQTYATTPKREQLCAAMRELAEKQRPPDEQATRIKALRRDWNLLGPATQAADRKMFDEFNQLAEQAFEPCRDYFANLSEEREHNLAARVQICEQLEGYLRSTDWGNSDLKAAEQIMRTAREEWRNFHPVDRTPGKPVEVRFEALQEELHTRIKTVREKNLEDKRAVVAEATALLVSDLDIDARINSAKNLQQRWRSIGPTPWRQDQILWREFRAACDALFETRDEARQTAEREQAADLLAVQSLVDEFATALDGDDPLSTQALKSFRDRFLQIPFLPPRLHQPLEKRFSELVKRYNAELARQRVDAARSRLLTIKQLDAQVGEQESAHRRGEPVEFTPPDKLFSHRWARVDEEVPFDALHRQVIEAEMAAGMESPPEDRELKMSIQVDMMNSGRRLTPDSVDPQAMLHTWCSSGPKDESVESLRERFFDALSQLRAT